MIPNCQLRNTIEKNVETDAKSIFN